MTREEALEIIRKCQEAYVLDAEYSVMLKALSNWESLFDRDRINNLRWDGKDGEYGLIDKLKLRADDRELTNRYRLDLATAISSQCSGGLSPEQIVVIALGIEDVIAAAKGRRRVSIPNVTVTIHDPPKYNYSKIYEAEIIIAGILVGTLAIAAASPAHAMKLSEEMTQDELIAHTHDIHVQDGLGMGWGNFEEKK